MTTSGNIDTVYETSSRNQTSHSVALGSEYLGRKFRLYVRQVLNDGSMSDLSDPAVITIGDTLPPPPPPGFKVSSQELLGSNISLVMVWDVLDLTTTTWEDLDHFVIYYWLNFNNLPSDLEENLANYDSRVYAKSIAPTADASVIVEKDSNTYTIHGTVAGQHCFVGLQAVDTAGNASNISVLHLLSTYDNRPSLPASASIEGFQMYQSIEVIVRNLPASTELAQIKIYRDDNGDTGGSDDATLIQTMPYPVGGGTIRYRDVLIGDYVFHSYRFSVVNTAGYESGRSAYSMATCAKAAPTSMLDNTELTGLLDAYSLPIYSNLEAFNTNAKLMGNFIGELSDSLKGVNTSVTTVATDITLLSSNLASYSAAMLNIGNEVVTQGTLISQNAGDIKLKASLVEMGNMGNDLTASYTSMFKVAHNDIAAVVTELNSNHCSYSAFTMLSNQVDLKVNQDGIISAINLSPEGVKIKGDKVTITGNTEFANDVTIRGDLYANDITIYNPDGSIAFGGDGLKYIPNMGFLTTGTNEVRVPPPGSYDPTDPFATIAWQQIYSASLTAGGLGNKFAVLNTSIVVDKDADCVVQVRMYAKYGDEYYYGSIGELSVDEYLETVQSFLHIPTIPSGTWEVGLQARRTNHTYFENIDGELVDVARRLHITSAHCQYYILGA